MKKKNKIYLGTILLVLIILIMYSASLTTQTNTANAKITITSNEFYSPNGDFLVEPINFSGNNVNTGIFNIVVKNLREENIEIIIKIEGTGYYFAKYNYWRMGKNNLPPRIIKYFDTEYIFLDNQTQIIDNLYINNNKIDLKINRLIK